MCTEHSTRRNKPNYNISNIENSLPMLLNGKGSTMLIMLSTMREESCCVHLLVIGLTSLLVARLSIDLVLRRSNT